MNLKSSPAKWVVSLPRPEVVNLIGLRSLPGRIKRSDSVRVEMQCINKEEFEYFSTLSQQTNFGINANTAPSNPKSNFNGNVLGFFSCHSSEYKSMRVFK